jgi:prevent-host-death family protein
MRLFQTSNQLKLQIQSSWTLYGGLMKALKISKDIITLAEFKNSAATILKKIGDSSQPVLITQNGRPVGVLLSPVEFDRIQEQERFMAAVNRGIKDADDGKVLTSAQAKSRLGFKK